MIGDDVTRIELAVGGGCCISCYRIVVMMIGNPSGQSPSPVTPQLLNVLTYNAGVTANDTAFKPAFYLCKP
jgi:hypothetical protein